STKDVVDEIIDKKIEAYQKEYSNVTLTAGENISYIEEKSFRPNYNEDEVRHKLSENIEVKADAYALKVDDEVVAYFKNKNTVSKLLKEYKTAYVDEKALEKLKEQIEPSNAANTYKIDKPDKEKALEPGDSMLTKVSFSKDVDVINKVVSPEKVITKKKGMKLLKKGTLEDEVHHVEKGDVLESIATDYDLTTEEILELNPDVTEDSILQIDQKIHVTAYQPFMDVLVEKDKVNEEK